MITNKKDQKTRIVVCAECETKIRISKDSPLPSSCSNPTCKSKRFKVIEDIGREVINK